MSDCNRYIIHNPGIQHSHTLRYFSQAHDQGSKNREQISTVSIIYFFLTDCYYYLLYLIIHTTLQFALEKQLAHRAAGSIFSSHCSRHLAAVWELLLVTMGIVCGIMWHGADWGYLHKHTHHYINNSAPAPTHYFTNPLLQIRILWNWRSTSSSGQRITC